jgi:hypothetical protein
VAADGQKIEYTFGKGSDVLDTIKNGLNFYKKGWTSKDIRELRLYIGADHCNGQLSLSVSQFAVADKVMAELVGNSDRFIRISQGLDMPVIFYTDILSDRIGATRSDVNMNGYYILIRRNNQGIWKVEKTQVTF